MKNCNIKNKIGNIRIEQRCGAGTYSLVRLKNWIFSTNICKSTELHGNTYSTSRIYICGQTDRYDEAKRHLCDRA